MGLFRRRYLPIFTVGSSALLYTIGTGSLWFVLPIFAEKIFKNLIVATSLLAVPNIVSLLFNIPLGKLSDRVGRKRLIVCGLLMVVLLGMRLYTLETLFDFVLFLIVFGIGNLFILVPSRAYVMEISPKDRTSEFFGIFEAFIQVGFTVGPVAAGYLIADQFQVGITNIGLFCSVACLMAVGILFFLKDTIVKKQNVVDGFKSVWRKDHVYVRGLSDFKKLSKTGTAVLLSTFIFVFIDGVIWAIEPLYTTMNLPAEDVGVIMGMFVLPFILFEAPAGWAADRLGKKRLFYAGVTIAGLSLIGFGLTYEPIILTVSAFFAATGLALATPALDGLLTDISSEQERGGIVGVWDMAEDIGYITSPIIGGIVAHTYGINTTFIFLGFLPLLGLPIFHKLMPKK